MTLLERRRALIMKPKSILPNNYQQVEYIESTGTQYVNIAHIVSSDVIQIETDFMITKWVHSKGLYGSQKSNDTNWCFNPYANYGLSANNWRYHIGTSGSVYTIYIKDNEWHHNEVSANNGVYTIKHNGETLKTGNYSGSIVSGGTFSIFTVGKITSRCVFAKIKTFKIFQDNILVCDCIPCYRKSDNVVGFYDLATDNFYTNQGTGEFLTGGDV